MDSPDPLDARRIIEASSSGVPPEYGHQFFTVGLNDLLTVFDKEYLSSFIKNGGSSFKLIVGNYGTGKTHLLYAIRDLAWQNNFVVSYVPLTPEETPFHKLELIYGAIVKGLMYPLTKDELLSGAERGIENCLKSWYNKKYTAYSESESDNDFNEKLRLYAQSNIKNYANTSFTKAVREAFLSLVNDSETDFENIIQWLKGEGYDRNIHRTYGILHKIDKTYAFPVIRSLIQFVRSIGYSGLIILFDEAERIPSLTSRQADLMLNNLRQLIDECHRITFQGSMIFYAVPDESILDGRGRTYEALNQRLKTYFEVSNPSGSKIDLERLSLEPKIFLKEVGMKLAGIYENAYDFKFNKENLEKTVDNAVNVAYDLKFEETGYKRLFVQKIITLFGMLRNDPSCVIEQKKIEEITTG